MLVILKTLLAHNKKGTKSAFLITLQTSGLLRTLLLQSQNAFL